MSFEVFSVDLQSPLQLNRFHSLDLYLLQYAVVQWRSAGGIGKSRRLTFIDVSVLVLSLTGCFLEQTRKVGFY